MKKSMEKSVGGYFFLHLSLDRLQAAETTKPTIEWRRVGEQSSVALDLFFFIHIYFAPLGKRVWIVILISPYNFYNSKDNTKLLD